MPLAASSLPSTTSTTSTTSTATTTATPASTTTTTTPPNDEDHDYDLLFYGQEEGASVVDMTVGEDASFLGDSNKWKASESRSTNGGRRKGQGRTARQTARNDDQDAWERNRLIQSGAQGRGLVDLDHDSDVDTRPQIVVHNKKPAFLDTTNSTTRVSLSKQKHQVQTVVDPTSDMAVNAKKGSEVVSLRREMKSRNLMRQRFWELGGSKMGNAIGIEQEQEDEDPDAEFIGKDGEIDVRKNSKFRHLVEDQKDEKGQIVKPQGSSAFSRNKTIKEQREYLPIFRVRDELLQVISDNRVSGCLRSTPDRRNAQGGNEHCGVFFFLEV